MRFQYIYYYGEYNLEEICKLKHKLNLHTSANDIYFKRVKYERKIKREKLKIIKIYSGLNQTFLELQMDEACNRWMTLILKY